jgi:adhesin transport system outer membrane protein
MTNRLSINSAVFLAGLTLSSISMADTLKEAIESAIHLNPDVLFASTHRLTTDQQLRQQQAGYLPTLDLAAGEGFQNSDNQVAASISDGGQEHLHRSESSLSLDQNLFAGFSTVNEVQRLKSTVKAAAYKTSGTSEDTALKVTEQYFEILRREKLTTLANQNLSTVKSIEGMIGERSKAGVGRTADLTQSNSRLALAQAGVIAEKGNLEDAKIAYMRVVGVPPKNLVRPTPPANSVLPATEQQAIDEAVVNHPLLKSANADIAAARAQHETSKSTNYPQMDLVFSASRNRNLDGQNGANNDERAMLQGKWNLFKGGKDLAHQRETAYQVQEAIEVRNRILWEVRETTRLSWNAWHVAAERVAALEKYRNYSNSTVAAYMDQFKLGQRTLLDLLNSQDEFYKSNVDYLNAEYIELYARYRLLNSMGKLMGYVGVAYPVEANLDMPKQKRGA